MSYYTFANLHYPEGGKIDPAEFQDDLCAFLEERKLHKFVGEGLTNLFSKGEAYFTFYAGCYTLEPLLRWVSSLRPDVPFGVQGRGEDVRDVWVREFSEGQITFSEGPFNEM